MEALDHYLKAVYVDPSDVELWLKIGQIAFEDGKLDLALTSYLRGLEACESGRTFACLDGLCQVFS